VTIARNTGTIVGEVEADSVSTGRKSVANPGVFRLWNTIVADDSGPECSTDFQRYRVLAETGRLVGRNCQIRVVILRETGPVRGTKARKSEALVGCLLLSNRLYLVGLAGFEPATKGL
jgi:hypothetical protein